MKILYIFPHPDDESFGPAPAMSKHLRMGHEVYLLTLTKGGATKQRHKFGYSIEEMGQVRYKEMLEVEKVLGLSGMTVLDLPDSGLKEMDPRDIENSVKEEIEKVKPNVLVTYAVHGISGFHDHLVCHAVVKRVFAEMKESSPFLKRLAFFTITEEESQKQKHFKLNFSREDEINAAMQVDEADRQNCFKALDCYATYKDTIASTDIHQHITGTVYFELFREKNKTRLADLFEGITA
jgi:LmbE family N-acetylglucosaminyl deacetylase